MSKVMRFYNPKTNQYEPINAGGVLDENTGKILTGSDIDKKADKDYVDGELILKADVWDLVDKADKSYVDDNISRTSTIVIANYDSKDSSKKGADIVISKGENAAKKINDAIRSLQGIGGEVKLMEGNYNLEYGIAVNVDGVHLTGIPKATILVQNTNWKGNPYNNNRKHIIDTWRDSNLDNVDVEISNLYVKGANISGTHGFMCYGCSTVNNCTSENNGNRGFQCTGSSTANNCTSKSNGEDGFYCADSSTVNNCTSENSGEGGFYCRDSSTANNCISKSSGEDGFSCRNLSIINNCISENSGSDGFYCAESPTVNSCTSKNSSGNGFSCRESSTVSNCISENSGRYGFACYESSTVSNCISENSGRYGFACYESSTVSNCISENSGSDGFACYESSTVSNCISENSGSDGFYCYGSFKGVCAFNTLIGDKLKDNSNSPAVIQYNIIKEV